MALFPPQVSREIRFIFADSYNEETWGPRQAGSTPWGSPPRSHHMGTTSTTLSHCGLSQALLGAGQEMSPFLVPPWQGRLG